MPITGRLLGADRPQTNERSAGWWRSEPGITGALWLLFSLGRVQEGPRAQPTCLPAGRGRTVCRQGLGAAPPPGRSIRPERFHGITGLPAWPPPSLTQLRQMLELSPDTGLASGAGRTQIPCLALPSVTGGFQGAEVQQKPQSRLRSGPEWMPSVPPACPCLLGWGCPRPPCSSMFPAGHRETFLPVL